MREDRQDKQTDMKIAILCTLPGGLATNLVLSRTVKEFWKYISVWCWSR